jgi:hypothetical protein
MLCPWDDYRTGENKANNLKSKSERYQNWGKVTPMHFSTCIGQDSITEIVKSTKLVI